MKTWLSKLTLFTELITRTDYTDSRTMLNGCTGKCVRLSRPLVSFWTHFKSPHFHFISFHFICDCFWLSIWPFNDHCSRLLSNNRFYATVGPACLYL